MVLEGKAVEEKVLSKSQDPLQKNHRSNMDCISMVISDCGFK